MIKPRQIFLLRAKVFVIILVSMKNNYFLRQNHKKATIYLKSSFYCFRRERQLIYVVLVCSILFCISGLVFSLLPQLLGKADSQNPANTELLELCDNVVRYIGFSSGLFLVLQMFVKMLMTRLHLEGVNSIERFDNYVFGIEPNKLITRPQTDAQLENNALRVRRKNEFFQNRYFSSETTEDPATVYEKQKEFFINEYHLMIFAKNKFFNWIWTAFFIGIFAFALIINTEFFSTLLSIFFPSISIISLIVSSMLGYNQSMRFLQNTLTFFESAENDPSVNKRSQLTLRLNQDAIFSYRLSSFNVPSFLVKIYEKSSFKKPDLASAQNNILKATADKKNNGKLETKPEVKTEIKKETKPELKPEKKAQTETRENMQAANELAATSRHIPSFGTNKPPETVDKQKNDGKVETKTEIKSKLKQDTKPELKSEIKPELKPEKTETRGNLQTSNELAVTTLRTPALVTSKLPVVDKRAQTLNQKAPDSAQNRPLKQNTTVSQDAVPKPVNGSKEVLKSNPVLKPAQTAKTEPALKPEPAKFVSKPDTAKKNILQTNTVNPEQSKTAPTSSNQTDTAKNSMKPDATPNPDPAKTTAKPAATTKANSKT